MRSIAAAGALASLLLGGCLKPSVNRCDNGAICKQDQACTEHDAVICGEPDRVSACVGLGDYKTCTRPTSEGSCFSGICDDCNVDRAGCHFPGWVAMTVPQMDLHGVWAADDTHAFAVGATGLLAFSGNGWHHEDLPSLHTGEQLLSIWGSKLDDIFIVSSEGRMFHFDGAVWAEQTNTGALDTLQAVSGRAGDDVYAVGFSGAVVHFNGSWQAIDPGTQVSFSAVDARGPAVFAVGGFGTIARFYAGTWKTFTVPAPFNSVSLTDVWAAGPDDAYAVGSAVINNNTAPVFHFNGTTWTPAIPFGAAPAGDFNAVWGTSSSNVYVAGTDGAVVHFDGTTWTPVPLELLPGRNTIEQIHGSAADDVFAVGQAGAIWHYTGQ